MEGKGLLKVMLTRFWLMIQTGGPLLGRSPASAGGLRQARSLGQKARSCRTGADAARSAVSCSPGARAGCFGPMSGSGLSRAAAGGKVRYSRYLSGPFAEEGGLLLSAVAERWDGVRRGQQGCRFLPPSREKPPGLVVLPPRQQEAPCKVAFLVASASWRCCTRFSSVWHQKVWR